MRKETRVIDMRMASPEDLRTLVEVILLVKAALPWPMRMVRREETTKITPLRNRGGVVN